MQYVETLILTQDQQTSVKELSKVLKLIHE